MIQLFGTEGDAEWEAACQLRDAIMDYWGEHLEHDRQKIALKTAAKCHGQDVRDIDVLLLISLRHAIEVEIPCAESLNYESKVLIKSLVVAIEVKDHPRDSIRFVENGHFEVRYKEGWKNASKQSNQQNYGLQNYLKTKPLKKIPFVVNVLWLRNLPAEEVPPQPHNILGADMDWPKFIRACRSQIQPSNRDGFYTIDSQGGKDGLGVVTHVRKIFTETLTPSLLDRRKLEGIGKQASSDRLRNGVAEQQLLLRGRGGTGKTIGLLNFAYEKYKDFGSRSLILTYNVALKSEIERLLIILQVRDSVDGATIRTETVHQFLRKLMISAGVLEKSENFYEVYEQKKQKLLEDLSDSDLAEIIIDEADMDSFDFVCVDEAQDFPENERDIIHKIFSFGHCVIADGIDQLVRPTSPCDWIYKKEIRKSTNVISLKKSLRLQSNLCMFANAFAKAMELDDWKLVPNPELPGGKIIVFVDLNPLDDPVFFDSLASDNEEVGNEPIDMLLCVPPSMVNKGDDSLCEPAMSLVERGKKVWDGTVDSTRRLPLIENDHYRLVQYESCRGLEGWVTFLFKFDQFFAVKQQMIVKQLAMAGTPSEHHERMAAEWMMIPLTRCINTLVIHLDSPDSQISSLIIRLANEFEDFVELRNLPTKSS